MELEQKSFKLLKRGDQVDRKPGIFKERTIGRLYTMHPNQNECFFLIYADDNVPRQSFQHLRIVSYHFSHCMSNKFIGERSTLGCMHYWHIQAKFVHCL